MWSTLAMRAEDAKDLFGGIWESLVNTVFEMPWRFALWGGVFLLAAWARHAFGKKRPRKIKGERHRAHRLRAERGEGLGLDGLAERLDVSRRELELLHVEYRAHTIPKRRGGSRTLHVPGPALKKMQRRILHRLLKRLRTHDAATGFEPRQSIAHHARMHVGRAVVIKMDIVDFFPNTSAERVDHYFRRVGWDAETAKLLTDLTTHGGGLPQGAPTSPRLSNLVNHVMDAQIERFVKKRKGTYTRYADDITISFPKDHPRKVRGTIQHARRVVKSHGYRIHTRGKLRVLRRHQQQRVTGLVVNEKVQLPRTTRRRLRAIEHRLRTTGQASLTREQLSGWQALQHMVRQHGGDPPNSR